MGKITRTNFGFVATRALTNAQVLAFEGAPIQILAAKAGVIRWPILACLRLEWAADYGNIDAQAQIKINTGTNSVSSFNEAVGDYVSGLLAAGESAFGYENTFGISGFLDGDIVNKNISVSLDNNGAGQLSGGDPANVLTVSVYCIEFPV
jgi:hypothetical protein